MSRNNNNSSGKSPRKIAKACFLGIFAICTHCPLGLGEIDGLLVPPGKAYKLLTDHLITG